MGFRPRETCRPIQRFGSLKFQGAWDEERKRGRVLRKTWRNTSILLWWWGRSCVFLVAKSNIKIFFKNDVNQKSINWDDCIFFFPIYPLILIQAIVTFLTSNSGRNPGILPKWRSPKRMDSRIKSIQQHQQHHNQPQVEAFQEPGPAGRWGSNFLLGFGWKVKLKIEDDFFPMWLNHVLWKCSFTISVVEVEIVSVKIEKLVSMHSRVKVVPEMEWDDLTY